MPKASVIVVSDRVHSGVKPDRGGDIAVDMLEQSGFEVAPRMVVQEGIESVGHCIATALRSDAALIVTCGGTGVRPRNLTPEATEPFLGTRLFAMEQLVLLEGLKQTRHAAMSRGMIGFTTRDEGGCLIVNAPGSPGGVKDTLTVILDMWPRLSEGLAPS